MNCYYAYMNEGRRRFIHTQHIIVLCDEQTHMIGIYTTTQMQMKYRLDHLSL